MAGDLAWDLYGIRDADTIFSEIVPVHVAAPKPRRVLVLSGTPSFELRTVKTFLLAAEYGVAQRQQISADFFHQAFAGMETLDLDRISTEILKEFSLLMTDDQAFQSLSVSEQRAIGQLLKRGELGVVWFGKYQGTNFFRWVDMDSKELELNIEEGRKTVVRTQPFTVISTSEKCGGGW